MEFVRVLALIAGMCSCWAACGASSRRSSCRVSPRRACSCCWLVRSPGRCRSWHLGSPPTRCATASSPSSDRPPWCRCSSCGSASSLLGFSLIIWWDSGLDFASALSIAGSSVFTLGIATANDAGPRTLEILAAGVGTAGLRPRDRLSARSLQRVRHPRDRGHAAGRPGGHARMGSRDPGPAQLPRHDGRAAAAVLRVGALGRRRLGEPRQLPGADVVPLTGVVARAGCSGWSP